MSFFQWLRTQSKFLSFIISSITVSCPVHRKCCFTANKAPLVHVAQTYILVVTIHCLALCHTNPSATCRVAPPPPPCAMLRPPPPPPHFVSHLPLCHMSCHTTPSATHHVMPPLYHTLPPLPNVMSCCPFIMCCIASPHVSPHIMCHVASSHIMCRFVLSHTLPPQFVCTRRSRLKSSKSVHIPNYGRYLPNLSPSVKPIG